MTVSPLDALGWCNNHEDDISDDILAALGSWPDAKWKVDTCQCRLKPEDQLRRVQPSHKDQSIQNNTLLLHSSLETEQWWTSREGFIGTAVNLSTESHHEWTVALSQFRNLSKTANSLVIIGAGHVVRGAAGKWSQDIYQHRKRQAAGYSGWITILGIKGTLRPYLQSANGEKMCLQLEEMPHNLLGSSEWAGHVNTDGNKLKLKCQMPSGRVQVQKTR